MQVVCERSNTGNDVRCEVCGQSFVVQWTTVEPTRRREARIRIMHALRRHHSNQPTNHHVHAEARFTVSAVPALPGHVAHAKLDAVAA